MASLVINYVYAALCETFNCVLLLLLLLHRHPLGGFAAQHWNAPGGHRTGLACGKWMCKYANDNGNVNWFGFRFLGFSVCVCNAITDAGGEARGREGVVLVFAHFVDFCVGTERLPSAAAADAMSGISLLF